MQRVHIDELGTDAAVVIAQRQRSSFPPVSLLSVANKWYAMLSFGTPLSSRSGLEITLLIRKRRSASYALHAFTLDHVEAGATLRGLASLL